MFTAEFIEKQMSLAKSATPRPWKWNAEDGSLLILEGNEDAILYCDFDAIKFDYPIKEDADLLITAVNNWTDALTTIAERDAAIAERDTEIKRLREALDEIKTTSLTQMNHYLYEKLDSDAANDFCNIADIVRRLGGE